MGGRVLELVLAMTNVYLVSFLVIPLEAQVFCVGLRQLITNFVAGWPWWFLLGLQDTNSNKQQEK